MNSPTIQAEEALLGLLIRDSLSLPNNLTPGDFLEPKHQDIASAITALTLQAITPDEITVSSELRKNKSTVEAYFISQMVTSVGYTVYQPAHAAVVKKASTIRRIQYLAQDIKEKAERGNVDPADLLQTFGNGIKAIEDSNPPQGPESMPIESLLSFDRKNDPNNVIGHRWLTKAGSLIISGQSGTGKSSLMMTAAINWALNTERGFFGIKAVRPLKTLVIQAENDRGDCAESMIDLCDGLNLSHFERETLAKQLIIYRENSLTGDKFGKLLRDLIIKHEADLVFIDPLLAYAGTDISQIEGASYFCRSVIQPILTETGCIAIFMHHTGKPRSKADKEGMTQNDNSYALIGSSELTNWAREIMTLQRCQGDEPIYKLSLNKRRGRSGMKDIDGNFAADIYVRHSREPGIIRWERSLPPTPTEGQTTKSAPADEKPTRPNRGMGRNAF